MTLKTILNKIKKLYDDYWEMYETELQSMTPEQKMELFNWTK